MEARPLTENRFVLEFDSEKLFKFITKGGPWSHRGMPSLWYRMMASGGHKRLSSTRSAYGCSSYDVPIHLMTKAFTHGPSEKINKDIVKVVGLVDDFLRVCLMFPLGDALIQCFVEQRVKGQGLLAFKVTYENVPN